MPKFDANLTMLFTDVEFLGRFERASRAGFKAVEYLFPYEWPREQVAEELHSTAWSRYCSICRQATGRPESEALLVSQAGRGSSRRVLDELSSTLRP